MNNDAKEFSNGDKKEKNEQGATKIDPCFNPAENLEKVLKFNSGAWSADTANQPHKQAEIVKRIQNVENKYVD